MRKNGHSSQTSDLPENVDQQLHSARAIRAHQLMFGNVLCGPDMLHPQCKGVMQDQTCPAAMHDLAGSRGDG